MSQVKLFDSSQIGAPSLSGTTGNLISLLDAILVNGFNLKTLDGITRSDSVATATCAAGHGYREYDVVSISGAAQAEYNGEFVITNVTSITFDVTVTGTPVTPATGTLTAKIAPLGWGKAFTGTNKAAYRASDVSSTRLYLRVDDTNAKFANVAGYETMTDVDTGTGQFMDTLSAWNKSNTADAVTHPWYIIGDGLAFYLVISWHASYANKYEGYYFGDVNTYKAGDAYHCALIAAASITSTAVGQQNLFYGFTIISTGKKIARSYSQLNGAVGLWQKALGASDTLGDYPSPVDNGLNMSQVYIVEGSSLIIRGEFPGWYFPMHIYSSLPAHGTVITDIPDAPGKRFFVGSTVDSNAADKKSLFDVTGPWR